MRETVIKAFDDLDWTENKERNEAAQTVLLGLDGEWREIDLTGQHAATLLAFVRRYMRAGNPPAELPKPRSRRGSPGYRLDRGNMKFLEDLRAWATERGFRFIVEETGKYSYIKPLREAFQVWQDTGQEPSPELAERLRKTPRRGRARAAETTDQVRDGYGT